MRIVTRAEWGAKPWAGAVHAVPATARTETLVHYHGGPPKYARGPQVPREVQAIHLANGWNGIGYNWLVDLDGVIYEGRGWDLVGAHCPGHNRTGIGIYVAIGGDQKPTDAALAAVRDLYDETCRRAGRALAKSWHGENYATACPGLPLIGWVRGGMKRPAEAGPIAVPASTKPTPRPGPALSRVLRYTTPMMHGEDVKTVQRIVGARADGWYGADTRQDVVRWQRAHRLTADGAVGPVTARAMGLRWTGPVGA